MEMRFKEQEREGAINSLRTGKALGTGIEEH